MQCHILKTDIKTSFLIRLIIRVNTEMLCSAAIGSDCWCFYSIPATLSLSLLPLLPRIIYSCSINAHFTARARLVFALILPILDTVHHDPKGEWARSMCENIWKCTWAHGLLFYILHITGVNVKATWTCDNLSIPERGIPHLWLPFRRFLCPWRSFFLDSIWGFKDRKCHNCTSCSK